MIVKCGICGGGGKQLYHDGVDSCMFCGGRGVLEIDGRPQPVYTQVELTELYIKRLEARLVALEGRVSQMNEVLEGVYFRNK